jgi:AcrR family transcriptional regulator
MAPPIRTPRTTWVDEGLRALATGGPNAVRIDGLAKALGVTRGGFYWHFADRQALLDEMLDAWERSTTDDVIKQVQSSGGDARVKLRRTFDVTSSTDGLLAIDLAVRDWARRDQAVAERLSRVDNRRMEYLRGLFAEFCAEPSDVEARSMLSFSLLIGNHFIAAQHGELTRADVVKLALRQLGK